MDHFGWFFLLKNLPCQHCSVHGGAGTEHVSLSPHNAVGTKKDHPGFQRFPGLIHFFPWPLHIPARWPPRGSAEMKCPMSQREQEAFMANLGWKMFLVYACGLWCSATPSSPALLKRAFPKAVVDFSQASLCTGQDCWQLNIQLQNIIFCHFDLCSSLQPESHVKKKKESDGVCLEVSSMQVYSSTDLAN